MNPETLSYFKQLILQKRQETMEEIEELRESVKKKEESASQSPYPYHMAELGTDAQEQEKNYLLADRLNKFLNYLNLALDRIEQGTFGTCTSCGHEITKERLEAVPHTQLCVDCKMKQG
ncbi:TraR/DksA family transcriptional regulator [candidate division KSB1 bacterium]|nr:TraR/DksA family transcriptional regulator [candidate division KSB1 bacterium]